MDDTANDAFLAGLLEFASVPESNGDAPPPGTDKFLHCGLCLSVKYRNRSSLDSHIQKCAPLNGYRAIFFREAGWNRAAIENGPAFTFVDGYPVVRPDRICQYCRKVYATSKEVAKHITARRCSNAQALFTASPAVLSGQWKCGFCGKNRPFTTEVGLDAHIKLCCPKNKYKAHYWKVAGWTPDSRYGKGLDFKDGLATAKPERICQRCYQCFKSFGGTTRHLENGQCPGEPDEKGWQPPPPPAMDDGADLSHGDIHVPVSNSKASASTIQTPQPSSKDSNVPAAQSKSDYQHLVTSTSMSLGEVKSGTRSKHVVPSQLGSTPSNKLASRHADTSHNRKKPNPPAPTPAKVDGRFADAESLLEVINTAPSLAITELLVKIARADPKSRAIPSAPVRARQKRAHKSDAVDEFASRTKVDRYKD